MNDNQVVPAIAAYLFAGMALLGFSVLLPTDAVSAVIYAATLLLLAGFCAGWAWLEGDAKPRRRNATLNRD